MWAFLLIIHRRWCSTLLQCINGFYLLTCSSCLTLFRYKVRVNFCCGYVKKVFPYSLPIPVYRQSARRWLSRPPGGRLPLLSARPAVTFPAEERHRPSAGTKLYCSVTEAHGCEQLAQGCYPIAPRPGMELTTSESQVELPDHYTTETHQVMNAGWPLFSNNDFPWLFHDQKMNFHDLSAQHIFSK